MTTRETVLDCLADVAPDADVGALDPRADVREALDLDSMDVFNLVAALAERTGTDIPDAVVARLRTVDDLVAQLDGTPAR